MQNCPLFNVIDRSDLEYLVDAASILNYGKGNVIIVEGQIPHSFQIIKSGLVKIFKNFPSGKQFTLDVCRHGEIFGEIAVIEGLPHYTSAEALENTEIISIPRTNFLNIMAHSPKAALKIASLEIQRAHSLSDRLIGLVTYDAKERIIKVIRTLNVEYNSQIHFNHKEIAEMSGTPPKLSAFRDSQ